LGTGHGQQNDTAQRCEGAHEGLLLDVRVLFLSPILWRLLAERALCACNITDKNNLGEWLRKILHKGYAKKVLCTL
ncbi:hypothetical protein OCI32_23935, partial [Salmonella enterica]|uniref:hypothetical protein n=1 Tax=Salmonella enterica TaxID=28901 RepID=UPI0022B6C8C1